MGLDLARESQGKLNGVLPFEIDNSESGSTPTLLQVADTGSGSTWSPFNNRPSMAEFERFLNRFGLPDNMSQEWLTEFAAKPKNAPMKRVAEYMLTHFESFQCLTQKGMEQHISRADIELFVSLMEADQHVASAQQGAAFLDANFSTVDRNSDGKVGRGELRKYARKHQDVAPQVQLVSDEFDMLKMTSGEGPFSISRSDLAAFNRPEALRAAYTQAELQRRGYWPAAITGGALAFMAAVGRGENDTAAETKANVRNAFKSGARIGFAAAYLFNKESVRDYYYTTASSAMKTLFAY